MNEIIFYVFASIAVFASLMVVASRNTIHSVFYLILVFTLSSVILLTLGVEFLGLIYIIVYVGAIAVLFLFIVMMLNIRVVELGESLMKYIPIGGVVLVIFFIEIYYLYKQDLFVSKFGYTNINWLGEVDGISNVKLLGDLLYTHFSLVFILAGLVLLLAMIGTIVLTLHHEINVRRQEVYKQVGRNYLTTVSLKKI